MTVNFFIFFSLLTILCSLGVIFFKSAVYSAFSLILCLFCLSALYVLWGVDLLAALQVLIYAGAIVVIFVFVVMLLNLGRSSSAFPPQKWFWDICTGSIVWFFALVILRVLNHKTVGSPVETSQLSMKAVSQLLFTSYLWPFEVLSYFLLAIIVSIYVLARTPEEKT